MAQLECASDGCHFGGLLWVVCADFVPKEELAKFMAQCGDDKLAQQVRDFLLNCVAVVPCGGLCTSFAER
jgi:hypothetical protein